VRSALLFEIEQGAVAKEAIQTLWSLKSLKASCKLPKHSNLQAHKKVEVFSHIIHLEEKKRIIISEENQKMMNKEQVNTTTTSTQHHGVLGRLVDESGEPKEPSQCIIQYGGRVRLPDKLMEILNNEFAPEVIWWQPDGECFAFDAKKVQDQGKRDAISGA
jgi:hypothetical protein